jgi:hypothetical protein
VREAVAWNWRVFRYWLRMRRLVIACDLIGLACRIAPPGAANIVSAIYAAREGAHLAILAERVALFGVDGLDDFPDAADLRAMVIEQPGVM